MKRLLLVALLAVPLIGCGEQAAEPTTPSKPLPESAGGQKLSYTAGSQGK